MPKDILSKEFRLQLLLAKSRQIIGRSEKESSRLCSKCRKELDANRERHQAGLC